MEDFVERTRSWEEYVDALQEERSKIQVFHRELPLCLQLVTQAIDSYRQQMVTEETGSDEPVLEEFIPLKPSSSSSEENETRMQERWEKKPDWLRSVQLWNQDPEPVSREDVPLKPILFDGKKCQQDFHPEKEEGQCQSNRKTRRCWSPELHQQFLHALKQLGGIHVATPKQIRELMKVDELTNDEVKSHLQKYRLHTRRSTPTVHSNNTPHAPKFLVVGGIWIPPPDYAAAVAAGVSELAGRSGGAPINGIYTPIASLPPELRLQRQQKEDQLQSSPSTRSHSERKGSHEYSTLVDDGEPKSGSPATSSSSHPSTASPLF